MVSIDLRTDAVDIQAMLVESIERYTAKHQAKATSKKYPPVSRIDLIYSLGDSESTPWVQFHLDTKPGAEPDGDPTHPEFATLDREAWLPAVQAVCEDETVTVVKADGKSRQCDDSSLSDVIGKFLVQMLLKARDNGVFANLPRLDPCELGVEDPTSGDFGWPHYEDRGKKNLVK